MTEFGIYYAVVGALVLLDILSGLWKAWKTQSMSSTKLRAGLYHKTSYVIILAMATILEIASVQVDIGYSIPIVATASIYIIATECVSICENAAEINPELNIKILRAIFGKNAEEQAYDITEEDTDDDE